MGVTPHLGLPYPELGDSPDVPRDIKGLAVKIESVTLSRTPQAGQALSTTGWLIVRYASPYLSAPTVVVSVHNSGSKHIAQTARITTTQFELAVIDAATGAHVSGIPVQWIATGSAWIPSLSNTLDEPDHDAPQTLPA